MRNLWVLAVVLASAGLGGQAGPAAEPTPQERDLLATLRGEAPEAERALACKRLAVQGSAASVPELAKLLDNPRLASWARIPLEAIPGPEADAALRDALARLDGRLLVGAINSLGVRRDAGAVPLLVARLSAPAPEVAAAAAGALGRIGTPPAAAALTAALAASGSTAAGRDAVAQACIECAEKRLLADDAAGAVALFDAVRGAEVAEQRLAEASRGVILIRGSAGIPLLVELLHSPARRLFNIGLFTARELGGSPERVEPLASEVDRILVEEIAARREAADAVRGPLVIAALADRGGGGNAAAAVRHALTDAARAGPPAMRLAAVAALGRLGDAAVVGPLLEVAGDPQFSAAVRAALAAAADPAIDAEIRRRLGSADAGLLPTLVGLVGDRRIDAVAEVVPLLDHADAAVRLAALGSLGATVNLANLDVLIRAIGQPPSGRAVAGEREAAIKALTAASVRMEDREACAAKLAAAAATAAGPERLVLFDTLGEVGGTRALEALAAAAVSRDEAEQDAATRLLGKWMTADAAPVLLGLSQPDAPPKYRTRALRGYLRIARQFVLADAERAAMCRRALAAATEEVDRKAVLEILKRYPGSAALEVAREAAKVSGLEAEAAAVAREIEQKLVKPAS